ncbi:MAG: deoxyribodipyrimidine photo-lyase, partial [Acidimicrobiia bacterium]|nr:deoxyribodipyrimidine photo-lyase [Acidimicrobiia bacterium]
MWFRRDLRLDDNPAWAAATAAHDQVVALFVLEPRLLNASGQMRRD